MNKIFPLLFILAAACSKKNEAAVNSLAVSSVEPSITSVSFYPVYSGSNESAAFNVSLVSDSNTVAKVDLILAPSQLRWTVKKPQTGKYIMYDHVGDYPTFAQGYFYFFIFTKKDGSTISTKPFQVY